MTLADLEKLEALHAVATPGEWDTHTEEYHADSGAHGVCLDHLSNEGQADKDATALAAIYNAFPMLAEAIRIAHGKLHRIGELLGKNGCECECDHHWDEHLDECEVCFPCQVDAVLGKAGKELERVGE